jgi:predicted DNA-binding transcriptional regulator AlpA
MPYLNKQDLVIKLAHFGVKSVNEIARLIKDQGLPAKYLSLRKVYFDEAEVEAWMSSRPFGLVKSNSARAKVIKAQRGKRKEENPETSAAAEFKAEMKSFKKAEA